MQWPALLYKEWSDTCETLHLWTQIIGEVRLQKMPLINHRWQVTLYVTWRGLGTSPIPDGSRTFDIDFDFVQHWLAIVTSDGERREVKLHPQGFSKAAMRPSPAFYRNELREFLLPYEVIHTARSPEDELMNYLESTYDAAAGLGPLAARRARAARSESWRCLKGRPESSSVWRTNAPLPGPSRGRWPTKGCAWRSLIRASV